MVNENYKINRVKVHVFGQENSEPANIFDDVLEIILLV